MPVQLRSVPMLRLVVAGFGLCVVAASACAQPLPMQPGRYAYPPMVIAAPQQDRERLDLGGGFIEYLFGDRPGPQVVVPPPQSEPDRRPLYASTDPIADPEIDPSGQSLKIDPRYMRQQVDYTGNEEPGTVVIDTPQKFLFLVEPGGKAVRYGIGVGRPGFTWSGVHNVTAKREWPDWYPPGEMLKRQPHLPEHMPGGPNNPLGARALYLGSTLYRIHGSNEPWTIGRNVSSGCIRMRNPDVIDLYSRVKIGTRVVVI